MKRILFLLVACIALVSCGQGTAKNDRETVVADSVKNGVEVLYFHGKRRCATCMAIEENTKAVVENRFANELKTGTVRFRSIDISKDENKQTAAKYQVTWSALFIVKHHDGQETAENLTEYAFAQARKAPDTFKAEIAGKIANLLQ